ncbi:uncharacterized protein G2W53_014781 [Senna tora]|uniref:Uncharacterized protein n=1 Tax=Senna tora TaxID=362788 RepID=A0A834WTW5_9FABA|nr:uncharacterized protein G2W53_014781 [Senna tora]
MENPKHSRARDFPHLPPNQTLPFPRQRRLLLLHSPEALLRFLQQDMLQRDDIAERSDATRRRRREIYPVAMDPPSVVRVFAADESVLEVELLLLILNIPQSTVRFQSPSSMIATINSSNISPIYQSTRIFTAQDKNMWKILNRVEQEISLTYLQTKYFLFCGGGGFFSFTLPKQFCVRVLMQRDDGAERFVRWPWIILRW